MDNFMACAQIAIPRIVAVVMQKLVGNSQADHESKILMIFG